MAKEKTPKKKKTAKRPRPTAVPEPQVEIDDPVVEEEVFNDEETDEEVIPNSRKKDKKKAKKAKGKKGKKNKRGYEELPEKELRRQLNAIERRATRRVVMIVIGIFSLVFALLSNYTMTIFGLFGLLLGAYGVIYSLLSIIRIKEVKWIFILIGLGINIAGLALSIAPSLSLFNAILDNLDAISSLF